MRTRAPMQKHFTRTHGRALPKWLGLAAHLAPLVFLAVVGVPACSKSSAPACVEGASAACVCPTGSAGAQVCNANGKYGPCSCAPSAPTAAAPSPSPSPPPTPPISPNSGSSAAVETLAKPVKITASSTHRGGAGYSYEVSNLTDGDLTTSWQPSKSARGAWFRLDFADDIVVTSVDIANGFQAKDRLGDQFALNSRIATGHITFSDDTSVPVQLGQDARGYVRFDIPKKTTRSVTVNVDSVHHGSKWNDLAVSEVVVHQMGNGAQPEPSPSNDTRAVASAEKCNAQHLPNGAFGCGDSLIKALSADPFKAEIRDGLDPMLSEDLKPTPANDGKAGIEIKATGKGGVQVTAELTRYPTGAVTEARLVVEISTSEANADTKTTSMWALGNFLKLIADDQVAKKVFVWVTTEAISAGTDQVKTFGPIKVQVSAGGSGGDGIMMVHLVHR